MTVHSEPWPRRRAYWPWGFGGFLVGLALSAAVEAVAAPWLDAATAHNLGVGLVIGATIGATSYAGDRRRLGGAILDVVVMMLMAMAVGWLGDRLKDLLPSFS